jgi:8-oxo-dGTP pyrophosphatase MutT (NUDIX family)
VAIREAATVMLVRDAPGLEVFMLRRNLQADFVAGAYVFPGGAVDADDRDPALLDRCHGRDDAEASALLDVPAGGLGFWVAAIRETFEEAGVLLARSLETGAAVDLSDPTTDARLEAARHEVACGDRPFLDVVERENLMLEAGALHVFSHWITPPGAPRRYDTWFFVAEAPEGHAYLHDDGENVESEWVRPADALARSKRGEIELIFPTMRSLQAMADFETGSQFVDAVQRASAGGAAEFVRDHNGERVLLPDEGVAGEGVTA